MTQAAQTGTRGRYRNEDKGPKARQYTIPELEAQRQKLLAEWADMGKAFAEDEPLEKAMGGSMAPDFARRAPIIQKSLRTIEAEIRRLQTLEELKQRDAGRAAREKLLPERLEAMRQYLKAIENLKGVEEVFADLDKKLVSQGYAPFSACFFPGLDPLRVGYAVRLQNYLHQARVLGFDLNEKGDSNGK